MTEKQDVAPSLAWTEVQLQHISPGALPMALHPSAKGFGVHRRQVHAGIHGGFIVGGRLAKDQFCGQVEELGLLASSTGE